MNTMPEILIPANQYSGYKICEPDDFADHSTMWQEDINALYPWVKTGDGTFWRTSCGDTNHSVIITGPTSSILDLGWLFVKEGKMKTGDSALSVSQYAGRGQKGRSWISPPDNLYAVFRFDLPGKKWENLISLITGYLLARSLSEPGWNIQLKWPNDLILRNKKVGGILVEAKDSVFLAGIGINLFSSPADEELGDEPFISSTHLYEKNGGLSPLQLWIRLLQNIRKILEEEIFTVSPEHFVSLLEPYLAFLNKNVIVIVPGFESFQALFTGLDIHGGLRIITADGEKTLMSAEILPVSSQQERT